MADESNIDFERSERITMFIHIVDSEGNVRLLEGGAPKLPPNVIWAEGMRFTLIDGHEAKVKHVNVDWDGDVFVWLTTVYVSDPFGNLFVSQQKGWTVSELGQVSRPINMERLFDLDYSQ